MNQRVASRMLSHMGYTVDVAVNGLEALKAWEKKHYDLVFMDIQVRYSTVCPGVLSPAVSKGAPGTQRGWYSPVCRADEGGGLCYAQ